MHSWNGSEYIAGGRWRNLARKRTGKGTAESAGSREGPIAGAWLFAVRVKGTFVTAHRGNMPYVVRRHWAPKAVKLSGNRTEGRWLSSHRLF